MEGLENCMLEARDLMLMALYIAYFTVNSRDSALIEEDLHRIESIRKNTETRIRGLLAELEDHKHDHAAVNQLRLHAQVELAKEVRTHSFFLFGTICSSLRDTPGKEEVLIAPKQENSL